MYLKNIASNKLCICSQHCLTQTPVLYQSNSLYQWNTLWDVTIEIKSLHTDWTALCTITTNKEVCRFLFPLLAAWSQRADGFDGLPDRLITWAREGTYTTILCPLNKCMTVVKQEQGTDSITLRCNGLFPQKILLSTNNIILALLTYVYDKRLVGWFLSFLRQLPPLNKPRHPSTTSSSHKTHTRTFKPHVHMCAVLKEYSILQYEHEKSLIPHRPEIHSVYMGSTGLLSTTNKYIYWLKQIDSLAKFTMS